MTAVPCPAPRRPRCALGIAVLAMLALLAVLLPAPASAQRCTVGVDISPGEDRLPSACTRFELPAGLRADGPVAPGPGAGVTAFASNGVSEEAVRIGPDGSLSRVTLPSVGRVSGAARGADGATWFTAGTVIGRIGVDGAVVTYPVGVALDGGIASGPDGAVWFTAGTAIGRISTAGQVSGHPLPAGVRTAGGIVTGPDGALWFSAGPAIGRMGTDGAVRTYGLGGLHADGRITSAGDGALWFTDGAGHRAGRLATNGDVSSSGLIVAPTSIVAGSNSATVWFAGQTSSRAYINRLTTRSLPAGHPSGTPCDRRHAPACASFPALPAGNTLLLDAFGPTGDVTRSDDGRIWFSQGRYIGSVMPFRGALLCGGRLRNSLNSLHAAADCTQQRTPTFKVTHSGVAYVRLSCPRLTLRYCAGTLRLTAATGSRRSKVNYGSAAFAIGAFDNPTVGVRLRGAVARRAKHGSVRVRASIDAHDGGGDRVLTGDTIRLTPPR